MDECKILVSANSRGKVGFKETVAVSAPGMPGGIYLSVVLRRKFMKNRPQLRVSLLVFILLYVFGPVICLAKYSGGTGTEADPYLIATAEDLNSIDLHVENFNKCFLMTADMERHQPLAQITRNL